LSLKTYEQRLTLGIIVLCGVLSLIAYWRFPLGNTRDEVAHYQNIDFYHTAQRFPVLPDDAQPSKGYSSYEGHQPPLYYMLMAAIIELGLPTPQSFSLPFNPLWGVNADGTAVYNTSFLVQDYASIREAPANTWYALRFVHVVLNIATVLFVCRSAGILFQEHIPAAIPLSVALFALMPNLVVENIGLNNNTLLLFLAAWITWCLLRVEQYGIRPFDSLWLGLLLGAGLLTKIYMVVFIPVVVWVYLRPNAKQALSWQTRFIHLAGVGALTILLAGWWYIRNWQLYDDVTAANVAELMSGTRRADITARELFDFTVDTLGRVWLSPRDAPLNWYLTAAWLGNSLFMVSVAALWKRPYAMLLHVSLPLIMITAIFTLYGAARNTHASDTQWIFRPAVPALCLLMGYSLIWLPTKRRRFISTGIILALTGGVCAYYLFHFLPRYPALDRADAWDDITVTTPLDIPFANGAQLLGYELPVTALHPQDDLRVRVCWGATQATDRYHAHYVGLVLPDGTIAGEGGGFPLGGRYPTTQWKPNTAYCEWVFFEVQPDAIQPRSYGLRIGMFLPNGDDITYQQSDGSISNFLIVDHVTVYQPQNAPVNHQAMVSNWGQLIDAQATITSDTLILNMDWYATAPAPMSYQYFVHVLDARGNQINQQDGQLLAGNFPTNRWVEGAAFTDTISLSVMDQATTIRFGFYDLDSGQRAIWGNGSDHILIPITNTN